METPLEYELAPKFKQFNFKKYLCPPAQLRLKDAPQGEGYGPGHCGKPWEEPQSLGQLHPFFKGELHLHHHHGCSEGVLPGEEGKESGEVTRDGAVIRLWERSRGEKQYPRAQKRQNESATLNLKLE